MKGPREIHIQTGGFKATHDDYTNLLLNYKVKKHKDLRRMYARLKVSVIEEQLAGCS